MNSDFPRKVLYRRPDTDQVRLRATDDLLLMLGKLGLNKRNYMRYSQAATFVMRYAKREREVLERRYE